MQSLSQNYLLIVGKSIGSIITNILFANNVACFLCRPQNHRITWLKVWFCEIIYVNYKLFFDIYITTEDTCCWPYRERGKKLFWLQKWSWLSLTGLSRIIAMFQNVQGLEYIGAVASQFLHQRTTMSSDCYLFE